MSTLPATTQRTCIDCGETKTLGQFYAKYKRCKPCARTRALANRQKRIERLGLDGERERGRRKQSDFRADPERRAHERLHVTAGNRAQRKLALMYPEAFAGLLRIERAALGLKPDPGPADR